MRHGSALLQAIYSVPSALYYGVQKSRELAYRGGIFKGSRAPVPVLSVGNILMGGSGKTPFAIFLARAAMRLGARPAIVSRGYKGTSRAPFLVVGDGRSPHPLVSPAVAGDEPWLMAWKLPDVPVLVGRKRIHPSTVAAEQFGCDLVILDDGFQHLELHRDLDIVLVDGSEDRMFPRGRLREPISALKRADLVCFRGPGEIPGWRSLTAKPVFRYRVVPTGLRVGGEAASIQHPDIYASREVVLVSGIANPDRFRKTAETLQWHVKDHLIFPDHHAFSESDLALIREDSPDTPKVFTEKDWVKLPDWFRRNPDVAALEVSVVMDDEAPFLQWISAHASGREGGR
ncbi:MAG: tetraacyldisaccharide 4'-kinase [Thermodesulfobacteriota bacterium]